MGSPQKPFWNYPVEKVKDCITVRTVPDPVPTTSTSAAALQSSTPAAALPSSTPAAALPSSTPAAALPSSTPAAARTALPSSAPAAARTPLPSSAPAAARTPLPSSPPVVPGTVAPEEAPGQRRRPRPRATSAELRMMFDNRNLNLAPEDDWSQFSNPVDVRRVQNRVSQRSYPTGMRRRIIERAAEEEAERMRANDALANSSGVPNTGMIDMTSLPDPTYTPLGGEWPQPPPDWDIVPGLESTQPARVLPPPPQATGSRQSRRLPPALRDPTFRPVWDDFFQSEEAGMFEFDSYPDNQQGNAGSQSSSTPQVASSMSRTDAEHLRSRRSPAGLYQTNRRAADLGNPTRDANWGASANPPNPFGFRSPQPSLSAMGQMSLPALPQLQNRPVTRNTLGFSSLQPTPSVLGQMSLPQLPDRPVVPWEQVLDPRLQARVFIDPWNVTGAGPSSADEENIESATQVTQPVQPVQPTQPTQPTQDTGYGAFEDVATAYYATEPTPSMPLSPEDHVSRSKRLLKAIANAYYGTETVPDVERAVFLQHVLHTVTGMLASHTTGSSSQQAFLWQNRNDASARMTLGILGRMVQREVCAIAEMQLDD
ncbi:hypothetical protein E4U32_002189 [Claviceps aff. humidiphila group G2b]|nr:hypothetical protein E4U32_002189 [Claviceps aff. humidiphila group G2b]